MELDYLVKQSEIARLLGTFLQQIHEGCAADRPILLAVN
jgi:hypothetical protein